MVLCALAGCTDPEGIVPSEDLDTSSVVMQTMGSVGPENKLVVSTILRSNGGEFVQLSGEDALRAGKAPDQADMDRLPNNESPVYTSSHDPAIVGEVYDVWLIRTKFRSATNTTFEIPPPFELFNITSLSRSSTTIIGWDNDDLLSSVLVTVQGECLENPLEITADVDQGEITLPKIIDATELCPLTVTVARRREGVVDNQYSSGESYGQQVRRQVTPLTD